MGCKLGKTLPEPGDFGFVSSTFGLKSEIKMKCGYLIAYVLLLQITA